MIVKQKKRDIRPTLRRVDAMLIGRYAVRQRLRSLITMRDLQEQEGDHKPSDEVDTERAVELGCRNIRKGGKDTGVRDKNGPERHPETTVGCEGWTGEARGLARRSTNK